jgi:SAM-dependent methyltransferase
MTDAFRFDADYLSYFRQRAETASDGTRIPGPDVVDLLIDRMRIHRGARVLDVGCGWGRLLPVLRARSTEVHGVDVSAEAVAEASRAAYRSVHQGSAENTHHVAASFDDAILFGVFDCCDQARALVELHRILRPEGVALITGKNALYFADDKKALIAERNARRRGFPNHFTYLDVVCAGDCGFEVIEAYRFARRGDFGAWLTCDSDRFYEYAVLLRRADRQEALPTLSTALSVTVQELALREGRDTEEFLLALPD